MFRHEAELARGLLKEENIESIVSADDVGGYIPNAAYITGNVKLLVHEEQALVAQEVLKVLDTNVDSTLWEEDTSASDLPETDPLPQKFKKFTDPTTQPLVVLFILLCTALIVFGVMFFIDNKYK